MIGSSLVEKTLSLEGRSFEFDFLGTRIRAAVDDPDLAQHLKHLLDGVRVAPKEGPAEVFEITGGQPQRDWILRHNGSGILQTSSRGHLIEHLFATLNELVLDDFAGVAIHAGVVAQGSRAMAIPGRSGAGKSTLTAACVVAGFAYVSDEALCLDRITGDVVAYPRPLMLSETSTRLIGLGQPEWDLHEGKRALSPADLRGRTCSVPLRLANVVLAERGRSLRLESIPTSEVIPELLERCFRGREDRSSSFELLVAAAKDSRSWRLGYRDAVDAAALLRRTLPFS